MWGESLSHPENSKKKKQVSSKDEINEVNFNKKQKKKFCCNTKISEFIMNCLFVI